MSCFDTWNRMFERVSCKIYESQKTMAVVFRQLCLPLRWKGIHDVGRTASFKFQFEVVGAVCFSNSSLLTNNIHHQPRIHKRIKKNDPEMEVFLNTSFTINRIQDLAKIMGCTAKEASELIKRDSPIGVTNGNDLEKKIGLLLSYGFSSRDIIANPAILHRTNTVLKHRLKILKMLKQPANQISSSILKKSNAAFDIYVDKSFATKKLLSSFSSFQNCIADILDCDLEKAEVLIDDYNLMSVSPLLLKMKIDIMNQFGVNSEIIQDNMRSIINVSASVLEERLQILSDNNLLVDYLDLKFGHLLTCKMADFEKYLVSVKDNLTALEGCENKKEYIMLRLKCSEKVADALVTRMPIKTMSHVKLKSMLDFFLHDMEVSCDFVISNVYLFGYSLERMQSRRAVLSSPAYKGSEFVARLFTVPNEQFEKLTGVSNL